MTQLNYTIKQEYIQNLINTEVENDMARTIIAKIFNELIEK